MQFKPYVFVSIIAIWLVVAYKYDWLLYYGNTCIEPLCLSQKWHYSLIAILIYWTKSEELGFNNNFT